MARSSTFGKDTGLQVRMTVVFFLLGALYVALVAALLASGASGVTVAVIAGGLAAVQLFGGDKLALRAMGGREVTPAEAPELHAMIDRLCVQADLPKPKVAVADTQMPNAFALGRGPKSATVCATTGIMELLSPAELEGVMAHELTHIGNRDVLVMTLAGFFATIAAYIVQFGFLFGGGGGYGDDDDNPSAPYCAPRIVMPVMIAADDASVITITSRWATWESSCARTPSSSSTVSRSRITVVTQTAEWLGERPVAKALGRSV